MKVNLYKKRIFTIILAIVLFLSNFSSYSNVYASEEPNISTNTDAELENEPTMTTNSDATDNTTIIDELDLIVETRQVNSGPNEFVNGELTISSEDDITALENGDNPYWEKTENLIRYKGSLDPTTDDVSVYLNGDEELNLQGISFGPDNNFIFHLSGNLTNLSLHINNPNSEISNATINNSTLMYFNSFVPVLENLNLNNTTIVVTADELNQEAIISNCNFVNSPFTSYNSESFSYTATDSSFEGSNIIINNPTEDLLGTFTNCTFKTNSSIIATPGSMSYTLTDCTINYPIFSSASHIHDLNISNSTIDQIEGLTLYIDGNSTWTSNTLNDVDIIFYNKQETEHTVDDCTMTTSHFYFIPYGNYNEYPDHSKVTMTIKDSTFDKNTDSVVNTGPVNHDTPWTSSYNYCTVNLNLKNVTGTNCQYDFLHIVMGEMLLDIDNLNISTEQSGLVGMFSNGLNDIGINGVGICNGFTFKSFKNSTINGFDTAIYGHHTIRQTSYDSVSDNKFLNCGKYGIFVNYGSTLDLSNCIFTGKEGSNTGVVYSYCNSNHQALDNCEISGFNVGFFCYSGNCELHNSYIHNVNTGVYSTNALNPTGPRLYNCILEAKENPDENSCGLRIFPILQGDGTVANVHPSVDIYLTINLGKIISYGSGEIATTQSRVWNTDFIGFYKGIDDTIQMYDHEFGGNSSDWIMGCRFIDNIYCGANTCVANYTNCLFIGDTDIMLKANNQYGENSLYQCKFINTQEGKKTNIGIDAYNSLNSNYAYVHIRPNINIENDHEIRDLELDEIVEVDGFDIGCRGLEQGEFLINNNMKIHDCNTGMYTTTSENDTTRMSHLDSVHTVYINDCKIGLQCDKIDIYNNTSYSLAQLIIDNCDIGLQTNDVNKGNQLNGKGKISITNCDIGANLKPGFNPDCQNELIIKNNRIGMIVDKGETESTQNALSINTNNVTLEGNTETGIKYVSTGVPLQFTSTGKLNITNEKQAFRLNGQAVISSSEFTASGVDEYYLETPSSYIQITSPYTLEDYTIVFDMPREDVYEDTDNNPDTPDEKIVEKGYFEGRKVASTPTSDQYVTHMYTRDPHWIVAIQEGTTYDEILNEACLVKYDYTTNGGSSLADKDTITGTYKYIGSLGVPVLTENDTYKYKLGDSIHLTPKGVKAGYEFIGWNTDPNAHVGLESLTATSGDITLYAIYKVTKPITYHTYNTDLDWTKNAVFYNTDTTINITLDDYSATENQLYNFKGYVLDSNTTELSNNDLLAEGTACELSIDDLNVYCVYDTSCILTYKDVDRLTEISTDTDTVRAIAANIVNSTFTFTVNDKENVTAGYTFTGWLDPVDEEIYQKDDTYTTSEHTATLVAQEAEILVTKVTVTPKTNNIYIGENVQLTAVVTPDTALDKTIVWSSSDDNIATVDQNGKVNGLTPGTVTITATNPKSGKYDTATVTVNRLHAIYNYTYNGGTSMSDVEDVYYVPTNELDLTPTANKEGYTFVGWNTDKDATTAIDSIVFEEEDITVYAIFKKDVTITYHTYNSTSNYTDTVTFYNNKTSKTKALKEYTVAINDLYAFVGYVLDENETNINDNLLSAGTNVTVPNTGLDIYCVYNTQSVLSYYDVDGQTFLSSDTKSMIAVAEAIIHQVFVFTTINKVPHDGYKFDGWLDSNQELHKSNTQYIITDHEATLIAKESEVSAESLTVAPKVSEIYFGDNVQLTATLLPENLPDKALVWSTNNDYTTVTQDGLIKGITPGTSTITVTHTASGLSDTATVKVKKLSLIYDYTTNGGTSFTDTNNTATAMYKPQMVANLTATAEKEGYTFVGWNTNKNATSGINSVTFTDSDIKVYAIFRKNVYIKYHTYNSNLDYIDTVVFYNNQETVNTTLKNYVLDENDLYTFKGYTLNRNSMTGLKQNSDQITVPITGLDVYCVYETTGKLIYKDTDLSIITTDTCKKQAVATDITNQTFTYTVKSKEPNVGYTFKGWSDNETLYQPNEIYTTIEHSATLIAIEEEILVTKVTVTPKVNEIYFDDTVQLTAIVTPETALDKTIVWSSENDNIATVDNNGLVTGHTLGNIIITATNPKSGKYDTTTVKVKRLKAIYNYTYNGGTSMSNIEDVWYKPNMNLDLTPIATKEGYTFVGWNTNKDATTGLDTITFEDSDITVYAIFKKTVDVKYHTYDTEKDYIDKVTFYNKQTTKNINLKQYPIIENSIYEFVGYSLDKTKTDNILDEGSQISVTLDGLDVYCVYDVTGKLIYKDMSNKTLFTDTNTKRAIAINIVDSVFNYTLKDKTPTEGYTFIGWLDEANTLHNSKDNLTVTSIEYTVIAKEQKNPEIPEARKVTITGILTYSDGTPIANKTITLNRLESYNMPIVASAPQGDMVNTLLADSNKINDYSDISYTTTTDKNGKYIFENIYVGNYVLDIFDNTTKVAECNVTVDVPETDSVKVEDTKDNVDVSYEINGNIFKIDATITNPKPDEPTTDEPTTETPTTETPTTETTTENTPAKVETPVVKTGDTANVNLAIIIMLLSLSLGIILCIFKKQSNK